MAKCIPLHELTTASFNDPWKIRSWHYIGMFQTDMKNKYLEHFWSANHRDLIQFRGFFWDAKKQEVFVLHFESLEDGIRVQWRMYATQEESNRGNDYDKYL